MSGPLNPDDVANDYSAYRHMVQAEATVQQFMEQRARAKAAAAKEAPAGEAVAGQPDQPAAAPGPVAVPPEQAGLEGVFTDRERLMQQARDTRGSLGGVLSDVRRGIFEAPRQFIGGVSDFVHNAFTAADHFGDWLNENVADLNVPLATKEEMRAAGVEPPPSLIPGVVDRAIEGTLADVLRSNPAEAIAGPGGEVGPAASVTGGIVREAARFLAGFKGAGKLLGAEGAVGFSALPAGAISDFVGQDPDAGRLADLWKRMGLPENQLTEYLASDPNDSEIEKRFKHALEGASIGALTEGVSRAAKYIRAKWIAGNEARRVGLEQADVMATQPRVKPADLAPLGDPSPDAPLVTVEKKLAAALDVTDTGVPGSVAAKGVVGTAKDAGAAVRGGRADVGDVAAATKNVKVYKGMTPYTGGDVLDWKGNVLESRPKTPITEIDAPDRPWAGMFSDDEGVAKGFAFGNEGKVMEATVAFDNPRVIDAAGKKAAEIQFKEGTAQYSDEFLGFFDDLQYDGVIIKNTADEGTIYIPKKSSQIGLEGGAPPVRLKATLGEAQITINFARMDTPENLQQVFRDTAEAFSGSIDEARRGVISLEETARMADRLGMTPEQLIARHRGQAFNAEQIKAAGVIMDSATAKVFELAERAAGPNASTVDQYMFRKMLGVHHAIQAEFVGAVAEAGRALNAVKIAQQGGTAEMGRAITSLVEGMGGDGVGKALAQRLMMLRQSGAGDAAMTQFIRKGAFATSMDAVKTFWINALLSNLTTHIVNSASNSLVVVQQVYERMAAEGVSGALGRAPGQGVAPGEAAAMLFGIKNSMGDAFRMAARAAKTGESEIASQLGKVDLPRSFNRGATRAISSTAFGMDEAGILGRTVDFLGAATETPGRLLMTGDEFFKSISYRMELAAQAFRKAYGDGLQGDDMAQAILDYMTDPPENMRISAADAALYNTFTNSTEWFGNALMKLRSSGGAANPITFIMPFVRTPLNISRYAFERSPVAFLVRQWRADVAAGGARADLALARMGTGTTIMLLASDLAMQGTVSGRGPKDPGEREAMMRQGWQPYSIKVGDRWYSYSRADPFGMTMGFAADFTEAMNRGDLDPEDVDEWQEVMAGMISSVAQVSVSKTYLSGMSDFFEMMGDPTRYSPSYVNRFIGSFVPSGVAATERLVDPVTREASTPGEQILSRIPGLSDRLTPRRDLWGEEMKPDSGLGRVYDTFSPVYARQVKDSPIDKEIVRLVADVRRITKKSSFQGVDVNFAKWPEVYDAYVRLAGNELKHPAWNMGAKDFLDAVVTGKHDLSEIYRLKSDGKDGGKAAYIRETIRRYRELAQREIMTDPQFEEFQRYIHEKQGQKRQRAMPSGLGIVLQ